MADAKISDIATARTLATILNTDLMEILGDPGGTPVDRKIDLATLRAWAGGLATVTGTDAATTMVDNSEYVVDMSAWATADRPYTMPASPVVGLSEVAVLIITGNASFELPILGNTGQTITLKGVTGAAASECTRLMTSGERMRFKYVATNKWLCTLDGRVPSVGVMRLSTAATAEAATTIVQPTGQSGVWTADVNVGSVCTTASDRLTARRAGNYQLSATAICGVAITAANYFSLFISKNAGLSTTYGDEKVPGSANTVRLSCGGVTPLALNDYFTYRYRSQEGTRGLLACATVDIQTNSFSLREIL